MVENPEKLNIVRIGSNISYSSLKKIGKEMLPSFGGIINKVNLSHHDSPVTGSVDAHLLTSVLGQEYPGATLGITDADLTTNDKDEFYNSIFGCKNKKNDVAVVSTKQLIPPKLKTEEDFNLFVNRTTKVALHEIGHNFGLNHHNNYNTSIDGNLCPMSKGEINKFGCMGYVKAIIDGRGFCFCEECKYFLTKIWGAKF